MRKNNTTLRPYTATTNSSNTAARRQQLLLWFLLLSVLLSPTRAGFFDDFEGEFGNFFDTPGVVVTPKPTPPPPTPSPTLPPAAAATEPPTPKPSEAAPPTSLPPTPPPGQLDFNTTSDAGENITITFAYGSSKIIPQSDDWIGIFSSHLHPSNGDPVSAMLFACEKKKPCQEGSLPPQEGTVLFGSSTVSPWPLPSGEYKIFFLRGLNSPQILAESSRTIMIQADFHIDRVVPAVQAIELELRNMIEQDPPMGPKFVRLGFHDCAGGCDGCVDLTFHDNGGLDIPINALAPIVQQHESTELGISRADIWALAAHVAADVAQTRSAFKGDFHMKFIGRHNCETGGRRCFDMNGTERECSATLGPHVHLPEADITTEEIFHFFSSEFGFDVQETVALMGAHTLGSLNRFHSGFDGPNGWVRDNLMLDNEYYKELIGGNSTTDSLALLIDDAPPWHRMNMDNSDIPNMRNKPAWISTPPNPDGSDGVMEIIMLNADIALVRELDHSNMDADGFVNCEFVEFFAVPRNVPRCPHAEISFQFAVEYKFDNDLWLSDFADVYKKMLNHGYSYEPLKTCAGGICPYVEVSFADFFP